MYVDEIIGILSRASGSELNSQVQIPSLFEFLTIFIYQSDVSINISIKLTLFMKEKMGEFIRSNPDPLLDYLL